MRPCSFGWTSQNDLHTGYMGCLTILIRSDALSVAFLFLTVTTTTTSLCHNPILRLMAPKISQSTMRRCRHQSWLWLVSALLLPFSVLSFQSHPTGLTVKIASHFPTMQSDNAPRQQRYLQVAYETKNDSGSVDVNGSSLRTSETTSSVPLDEDPTPSTRGSYDVRRFRCASYLLVQAAGVGLLSGWSVAIFKILVDTVKHMAYAGTASAKPWQRLIWLPVIPTVGGLIVALLRRLGGGFPPGMRDTIISVDRLSDEEQEALQGDEQDAESTAYHPIFHQFRFVKKSLAAVLTLGTGCSLGPEGPSVEIGMNLSRLIMDIFPVRTNNRRSKQEERHQKRLLIACGAAAGVSAGFNAPIAGAFFALEIMQHTFSSIDHDEYGLEGSTTSPALTVPGSISAVLIASATSALVCQSLLGEHLLFALKDYAMNTPLLELPIFLLLGATSGLAAFFFTQISSYSRRLFQGTFGPRKIRNWFSNMPSFVKPALGGLTCGLVGLVLPQILFSGFDTVNVALSHRKLPTLLLLTLLGVKMVTTGMAAGSGLVGGTFAPSLFLGGILGAAYHNIVSWLLASAAHHGSITLASPMLQLADLPAYTMVGAATVLAAVFRAPLTASLLLFELTRDYGVILPLMAASGVASIVSGILDIKFETHVSNKQSNTEGTAEEGS